MLETQDRRRHIPRKYLPLMAKMSFEQVSFRTIHEWLLDQGVDCSYQSVIFAIDKYIADRARQSYRERKIVGNH